VDVPELVHLSRQATLNLSIYLKRLQFNERAQAEKSSCTCVRVQRLGCRNRLREEELSERARRRRGWGVGTSACTCQPLRTSVYDEGNTI